MLVLRFALALLAVGIYILLNFYCAERLIKNFSLIKQFARKNISDLAASLRVPTIIISALSMTLVPGLAMVELSESRSLLVTAGLLLVIGLFPILVIGWSLSSVERVRGWWDSRINQLATLILFAILTWLARNESASILNDVYPVDPSNLPSAMAAGTFFVTMGFCSLLVVSAALIIEVVSFLVLFEYPKSDLFSLKNAGYALAPITIFLAILSSSFSLNALGLSPFAKLLIIRIAYDYDFIEEHLCYKKKVDEKVLFLNGSHERILVASALKIETKSPHTLTGKEIKKWYPANFKVLKCYGE